MKQKLFSVTLDDCTISTFTVGGNGGSGKDTSNTGVRIQHPPSGAVGTGRELRSQLANKRAAFVRMAESSAFQSWARVHAAFLQGRKSVDQLVEEATVPSNLKVEMRGTNGQWEAYKEV